MGYYVTVHVVAFRRIKVSLLHEVLRTYAQYARFGICLSLRLINYKSGGGRPPYVLTGPTSSGPRGEFSLLVQ
jgi:hypothetical protein